MTENKKIFFITSFLIFIYIVFFNYVCFLKYISFSYHDWDLAIYSQFFYNALRRNFFSSLLGINFFGNHLNIILFLLLPIFFIFSNPYTLLFLQTLLLGLAAYPLYFIAKEQLNENIALLFAFLYLLHPGINYTNLNEFHPESFFPLLFFCAFYNLIKGRTKYLIIFALLCLMLKENISLVIAMLGLYCILEHKNRVGLVLLVLSIMWLFLAFAVIIPQLNKGRVGYFNIYPYFGNQPTEVIKNIILHPMLALKVLWMKKKILYVVYLFAPLSFLPILNLKTLFLSFPLFLQHLLSSREMDYNIGFYYSAELLPIVFISAVYGLKYMFRYLNLHVQKRVLLLIPILGLISSLEIGPLRYLIKNNQDLRINYLDLEKSSLLRFIPKQSPAVATFEFLPYLSNRKYLYSFHYIYTGHYILSELKYELPDFVEYAIIDLNDPKTFGDFYNINNYKRLQQFFLENNWRIQDYVDTIILLKKEPGAKFTLCQQIKDVYKGIEQKSSIIVDTDIALLSFDIDSSGNSGLLNITLYWGCLKPTEKDINIILDIVDANDKLIMRKVRPICYRIFPTNSWQKGQIFKEESRIKIPPIYLKNRYKLKIGFFDYRNGKPCKINAPTDDWGRAFLTQIK